VTAREADGQTPSVRSSAACFLQQSDPYHAFPLMSATGGYVFGTKPDGTLDPLDVGLNNNGAIRSLEIFDKLLEVGTALDAS